MISYFQVPAIHITQKFEIYPFALLVATGVASGNFYAVYRARKLGFCENKIGIAVLVAVIPGFIISHIVDVLFYTPHLLKTEGILTLFKFWKSLSSMGGFLGAAIGMTTYYGIKKQKWWKEADIIIESVVIGWIFGRLGCTISHDHQGVLTDFFLAVNYPEGARHNLGFYEFLYTLIIMLSAVIYLNRKKNNAGTSVAIISLLYAPVRFMLDFLRAEDISGADLRYFGLTAGQHLCLLLMVFGLWVLKKSRSGALG